MSSQSLKVDVQNRELREKVQLNAGNCRLCAEMAERFNRGDRLWPCADPNVVVSRPVCFPAKHEGSCAVCGDAIRVGQLIWWAKGVDGVECSSCGGKR